MATPLTVPRRYQSGLAKIRDLDDKSTQELLAALQKIPPTVNSDSLASAVAAMVDTIAVSNVEEIVPALLSLYSIKDDPQFSALEVAQGMALGMEEIPAEELRSSLDEEQRDSFQNRLLELLSIDALSAIARAGGLLLDNEHSLRRSRIITDIRPIFEPDKPQAPPAGAVIVHMLKISYWADNEVKNFFVALDTNDVRELSEQLERANSKAESLKSVLEAANVSYIDAE